MGDSAAGAPSGRPSEETEEEPSLFVSGGHGETTAMDRAVLHNPTVIALIGILLRCCIGLHPHSGQGKPPEFGDFERERKLMQISLSHPVDEWYTKQSFPFPPLHAYFSLFFGKLAETLVPKLVDAVDNSGYESDDARAYLRATVLFCDLFIFFTATWFFCHLFYRSNVKLDNGRGDDFKDTVARFLLYSRRAPAGSPLSRSKARRRRNSGNAFSSTALAVPISLVSEVFLIILLQPSLVLIDHGHFGYNIVHLGLMIWTLVFCLQGYFFIASVSFALVLSFNQVALVYAPPILLFLLSNGLVNSSSGNTCSTFVGAFWRTFKWFGSAFVTIILLWAPASSCFKYEYTELQSCFGPKLVNKVLSSIQLPKMWPGIIGCLPSLIDLVRRKGMPPRTRRLVWSIFNCSLGFSLFSQFGTNDPNILFALLPAALLVGEVPGPSCWFSVWTVSSLGPLLYQDKLAVPAIVSTCVFAATSAICFRGELRFLPLPWIEYKREIGVEAEGIRHGIRMVDSGWFLQVVGSAACLVGILSLLLPSLNTLWALLHQALVFGVLFLAYMYGNWYQWMLPDEEVMDSDWTLVVVKEKEKSI